MFKIKEIVSLIFFVKLIRNQSRSSFRIAMFTYFLFTTTRHVMSGEWLNVSFCSNGTSMISLIIPQNGQLSIVNKMLTEEMGTAARIKSRVNRQSVQSAISSVQQRLKLYRTGQWYVEIRLRTSTMLKHFLNILSKTFNL